MGAGLFSFGRFRLVVRERVLLKDDAPVSLGSRAFDLLLALIERAGETVNREELLELVWPDVIVAKVNLRVHVAGLRRALGDDQEGNRFIVSVPGRGYRFIAPVSRFHSAAPATGLTRLERLLGCDATLYFVDFAGLDDPAQVAATVASVLGHDVGQLRDKRMLLVLDNCEPVFAGVAQLMERLLVEAPLVHILISRG